MKISNGGKVVILDELEEKTLAEFVITRIPAVEDDSVRALLYSVLYSKCRDGYAILADKFLTIMEIFQDFPIFYEDDLVAGRRPDNLFVRQIWCDCIEELSSDPDIARAMPRFKSPVDELTAAQERKRMDYIKSKAKLLMMEFEAAGHRITLEEAMSFLSDEIQ